VKEQVITQKVGNRSGIPKGRAAKLGQRPAKRESDSFATRLRTLVGYFPVALKVGLAIAIAVLAFLGYRAAASASFFQVRHIETKGVSRASNAAIQAMVRQDLGPTGVWRADLNALSQHLQSLPWVRVAVVTRVLPDGIRIRITEREPKAVARFASGRFFWVDDDAVTLGEMSPTDQMPTFFLRGWNEEESQAAQAENKERVKKFLQLLHDWTAAGIAERVSEVNLLDLGDVRAQLAGDDSQIELRLGAEDQSARLAKGLEVLDRERKKVRGPFISYIDLTQTPRRSIVGTVSGTRTATDPDGVSEPIDEPDTSATTKAADKKPKEKDQKTAQAKKVSQKRT
jgi:cell division septal protein FtsQ